MTMDSTFKERTITSFKMVNTYGKYVGNNWTAIIMGVVLAIIVTILNGGGTIEGIVIYEHIFSFYGAHIWGFISAVFAIVSLAISKTVTKEDFHRDRGNAMGLSVLYIIGTVAVLCVFPLIILSAVGWVVVTVVTIILFEAIYLILK